MSDSGRGDLFERARQRRHKKTPDRECGPASFELIDFRKANYFAAIPASVKILV
jgi:hypothetical protein